MPGQLVGRGTGGFAHWTKLAQNFGAAKGNEVPWKNELKGMGHWWGCVLYTFIKKYIQIHVYIHIYGYRYIVLWVQQVTILISPPIVFIKCVPYVKALVFILGQAAALILQVTLRSLPALRFTPFSAFLWRDGESRVQQRAGRGFPSCDSEWLDVDGDTAAAGPAPRLSFVSCSNLFSGYQEALSAAARTLFIGGDKDIFARRLTSP